MYDWQSKNIIIGFHDTNAYNNINIYIPIIYNDRINNTRVRYIFITVFFAY